MNHFVFIFGAAGYFGALFASYSVGRNILDKLGASTTNRGMIYRVGGFVGALFLLPASFLAVVVGGTIGGAIGESAGVMGVIAGIGLGVFVVTLAGILIPTIVAGWLARNLYLARNRNLR